jgi:uncharacterized protein YjbI with pentapeptide repeats
VNYLAEFNLDRILKQDEYPELDIMADNNQLEILSQGVAAWNKWREENPDVLIDLNRAKLMHMNLENANLVKADLKEANLAFTNFKNANLVFSNLESAIFSFSNFEGANFSGAQLQNAYLEDANLSRARLSGANLKNAIIANSNLKDAYLVDAHLEGTNLNAVNFQNANLSSVTFDQKIMWKLAKTTRFSLKKLWNQRDDILLDTTIRCKGVNAATCYGSQQFKLFLQDQDFLEEYLEKKWGRRIFFIWWLFADCGRSLGRWAGWSLLLALLFTFLFWQLGSNSFNTQHLDFNFLTMFYYSVVTFTTLGFGDIIPKTSTAALCVTVEVILGYVMLGGLITIFASKLSRRGG